VTYVVDLEVLARLILSSESLIERVVGWHGNDLDDLIQATYLKASSAVTRGKGPIDSLHVLPWTITIARRVAIDLARHESNRPHFALADEDEVAHCSTAERLETLDPSAVDEAIEIVRENFRGDSSYVDIVMLLARGYSKRQIADYIGESPACVFQRADRIGQLLWDSAG
jgi:DNA-directed RNA polymerase specialized sigma24 family protein